MLSVLDVKPSKYEILREVVSEKLTAAAREILAVVERTVSGYEEEAAVLRREIERQRSQLEAVLQPRVSLCRTGGYLNCIPANRGHRKRNGFSGVWKNLHPNK